MGQLLRLGDVIDRLSEFDSEDTIYASEPWTENSEAVVAREPDEGGLPSDALHAGTKYFLEVGIANEVMQDWVASLNERPEPSAVCRRVIDYAINDA
jgi:hypothetical protein